MLYKVNNNTHIGMILVNTLGLPQTTMALMAGAGRHSISRYVNTHKFSPLPQEQKKTMRYSLDDVRSILMGLFTNQFQVKENVLSFYNFKGGTGKTSLCYQVSTHLALYGFNVLVIDADPQAHLTTSLQMSTNGNESTLFDIMYGTTNIKDAIKPVFPGLDCIPSNLSLTKIETFLNSLPKREERVKMLLNDLKKEYDYIIFDTNPSISHLNRNIMTFTDLLNIVCETQPYSLNGMKILMEDNKTFYDSMQISPPKYLIIPNKYEDRASSSAEAMTALRQYYGEYLIADFAIRKSEDINASAKYRLPLAFFAKSNSNALADVIELIHDLIKMTCTTLKDKQLALTDVKVA